MKTHVRNAGVYILLLIGIVLLASCGHSRKNKTRDVQPQDSAIIIEQESVVVEVDSIVPDTTINR